MLGGQSVCAANECLGKNRKFKIQQLTLICFITKIKLFQIFAIESEIFIDQFWKHSNHSILMQRFTQMKKGKNWKKGMVNEEEEAAKAYDR